jgi:hypothetical protein
MRAKIAKAKAVIVAASKAAAAVSARALTLSPASYPPMPMYNFSVLVASERDGRLDGLTPLSPPSTSMTGE